MKVLFNTYPTAFQSPGGGEVIIVKLKEYLEKLGHKVDLFNQWEHKISDYDLVHEFSLLNWRNWNYYKLQNRPFVLTPTAWPRTSQSYKLKYFAKEKFKILLSKNGGYPSLINDINLPDIICPTTSLEAERLVSFYGEHLSNKIQVIHNGVDLRDESEESCNAFLDKYKVSKGFLLFVGSLRPNKNVEVAIEMARAAGRQIVIVGDGSKDFEDYAKKIKDYESEAVILTGFLPNESSLLQAAYQLASAIIIPSDFETCSLVGLEAGIYGTPVFITKNGGTKEIYQNHATYIDPSDIEQCRNAMANLLDQKDQTLRCFVRDHYSWEKIAQQYVTAYEKVLR